MSQTNPVRTSTWRQTIKAVMAGLVFLPILALTFVEWFVDPLPNSLWILRILNTKYLVHVRADLTVDGEPLVMERTFRCYDPVDYSFLHHFSRAKGYFNGGNVGDSVHVTTSKGRLFSIVILDVCNSFTNRWKADRGYYRVDPDHELVPTLTLSKDEIKTPIVFEIIGGRKAEQLDAYAVPDLLRQGYHGVKLDEVVLSQVPLPVSPWDFSKDWDDLYWFGPPGWQRPMIGLNSGRGYIAGYVIPITEDYWKNPVSMDTRNDEILAKGVVKPEVFSNFASRIASLTEDTSFPVQDWSFWGVLLFLRDATFMYGLSDLNRGSPVEATDLAFTRSQWAYRRFIPCRFTGAGIYECNPDMAGVMQFRRSNRQDINFWKDRKLFFLYKFSNFDLLSSPGTTAGAKYRLLDKTIYVGNIVDTLLGEE